MKKILLCFILLFPSISPIPQMTYAANTLYAKVEKDDVFFYSSSNDNSKLFIIPSSYFVKITGQEGNFFNAEYKEMKGYVKINDVSPMDGIPSAPFFNETFRAFLPDGIGLYTAPSIENGVQILTIPYLCDTLSYYGKINGEISIPDKGGLWYYCKYNDQFGYVYSVFCDKLSQPPENTERFSYIKPPYFNVKPKVESLSSTAMAFIIIGVSLPCQKKKQNLKQKESEITLNLMRLI